MKVYPRDDGNELANRQVLAILPYCRGERGLDVGCGQYKSHPLAIGLDHNPFLQPDLVADGANPPFPNGHFDFVTAIHNLEHHWNPRRVLRQWLRVLKPGGHLCLVVPDRHYVENIGHPHGDPTHRFDWTPDEFHEVLRGAGDLAQLVQFDTLQDHHGIDAVLRRNERPYIAPTLPGEPAPSRPLQILFCAEEVVSTNADAYLKAFQEMGHRVVTVGPWRHLQHVSSLPVIVERCEQIDFHPDLVIEYEGGFSLTGLEARNWGFPLVWIENNPHLFGPGHREKVSLFDFVFTSQKSWVDFLRGGNPNTYWLPPACDPEIYPRLDLPETHDLGYVGHPLPEKDPRHDLFRRLSGVFSFQVVSGVWYSRAAAVYSRSRIVFHHSSAGNLSTRPFEGLACGRMVLSDACEGLLDLFQDRRHLVTYRGEEELEELARYYLGHEEECRDIAEEGYREFLARHTYRHRAEELLGQVLGEGKPAGDPPVSCKRQGV